MKVLELSYKMLRGVARIDYDAMDAETIHW